MSRVSSGWVPSLVGYAEQVAEVDEADALLQSATHLDASSAQPARVHTATSTGAIEPLDQQGTVNTEADKWIAHGVPPQITWPLQLGERLPVPSVDDLRAACAQFPAGTGLGWDGLHPRALMRLSDASLHTLTLILMVAEQLGRWPTHIGVVVIALLAKTDGGFRPIGLFPSPIRVWMRLRLSVAQRWQAKNDRDYFYAGESKGATVATWKQAARAELAAATPGAEYGAGLPDLVKAFERVPHDLLVRQARKHGYALWLLRLTLAAYQLARATGITRTFSKIIRATRGITAGSTFATGELRVLLITSFDRARRYFPRCNLSVYVDDVGAELAATRKLIMEELVPLVLFLAEEFTRLRLEVSPTKNMCLASTAELGRALAEAWVSVHATFVTRARSLGAGLGAGTRRNVTVLEKRFNGFRQWISRFRMLKRSGVDIARLIRTGGAAALTYDEAITGVAPNLLLRQRRAVAATVTATAGGGDLDLILMVADGGKWGRADPAFEAHIAPIGQWAQAVWHAWLPLPSLNKLLSVAPL